jgi:ABC-type antimicrobial peptide transport system permease subunit
MAEAISVTASIKTMFIYISVLAIVISMMGLFALVSLNIARRTKEIGIRKVLGATMLHIMRLVNREFVSLLTAAAFIASVAGYFTVITDYWTLRSTFQSPWQDQLAATTAAIIFR